MDLIKKIYGPLQTIVLFLVLALSLAYLMSHDYVIRPPAARSRQSSALMQKNAADANNQAISSSKSQNGRLRVDEIARIANAS